ncbi:PKD domain-containing protein [Chitinophaga sp. 212800010-3]|uniref:PKD domain-containing protein n=1 Tax=unclassified Chitinophaga TaxID=2619133 RepID=UPI002DEFC861|nr:PKD domain-containing protein [Chitinophaga sp. 212800010-3]
MDLSLTSRKSVNSFIWCCFVGMLCIQGVTAQQRADFTASSVSDCESLITSFTDKSTGSPVAWQWDFGNGITSNKQNPEATYVSPGSYTVTLTATYADGSNQVAVKTGYITVWSKPVVDLALSPPAGCVPFTVVFTNKSQSTSGTLQRFSWDFGDGNVALNGSSNTSHIYTQPGTYSPVLTVTDNHGCTNFKVLNNAVTANPGLQANFALASKIFCAAPANVIFTNTTVESGTVSYKWEFDDGTSSISKDPGSHTFTTKGTHSIKLTATNDLGCIDSKTVDDINIANFATTLVVPPQICAGTTATFSATFAPAVPQSTTWEVNGLPVQGYIDHTTYNATATGPLTVKLKAMYGTCPDSAQKATVVVPSPTVNPGISILPFCVPPATVNFVANSTNADTWQWDFDDGTTAAVQNPSHIFKAEKDYNVKLTASNQQGCTVQQLIPVGIHNTAVTIYTGEDNGCEHLSTSFTASVNNNDKIQSYQWDFGDGGTSTVAAPLHTFTSPGIYTVKLTYVTNNGCSGTTAYQKQVIIYKKPTPDFTSPEAPQVCGNTPVIFFDKSDVGTSWYWNFGDGSTGQGNTVSYSYSAPGTYDVTLTVHNGSCFSTITKKAFITAIIPFPRFDAAPTCDNRMTLQVSEYSIGASSLQWDWGDGKDTTYTTHSDALTHTYAQSGTYRVKLTTSDNHCNTYLIKAVTIIGRSAVVITADKTSFCSSDHTTASVQQINTSILGAQPYHWQADGNDVPSASLTQNNYTYSLAPGKHTLRLLAQNSLGCYDTSNTIEVNVKGPVAGFNMPTQVPCRGTEVVFTDNTDLSYSSGIQKWVWNFGDNTPPQTFTSSPFRHIYQQAGTDILPSVTVTDNDGCTSTSSGKYLQINGPNADFNADSYFVKPGSTVHFSNTTTETGGKITNAQWAFGDGSTIQTLGNTYHYYPDKGVYEVSLHVTDNNGCTGSITKPIKVSTVNASFTYTSSFVNGGTCAPMIFRFTNNSVNATSYLWDFGDGGSSNQANPVHTYTLAGHYKVILKVASVTGATDADTQTVVVTGPYASIKASADGGCLGKEITFTVTPENASTFSWDFADGTVQETTALQTTHQYPAPGVYNPRLLLRDDAGCRGNAFLDHPIVIDNLNIRLHPNPGKICNEGLLTLMPAFNSFSVDSLGIQPTFAWGYDASLKPQQINTTTPSFYLNKAGEYTFTINVSTKYGCQQKADTVVHVYPKPLATISGPDKVCQDVPVKFSGAVTVVSNVSWNWNFGNGMSSQLPQPLPLTYTQPGMANVTLTVTSSDGCSDQQLHTINVFPAPNVNASAPATFICLNNSMSLHAEGGSIYEWTPATGLNNPAVANPVASPQINTVYQVKVTDSNGCTNTGEVPIRVVQPFKIHASADTMLCLGGKLPLSVSGADSYTWTGTNIDMPNSATPTASPSQPGQYVYNVTGYDNEGCFSDKAAVKVQINALPQVKAGPDRTTMAGTPVYLNGTYSSDVVSWLWSPATDLSCATCPTTEVVPNLSTRYVITVENTYGCKASDSLSIHLLCNQSAVYMPTAFTPGPTGNNQWVYPKGKGIKEIEWLRIYDRWGSLVFENAHFPINVQTAGWNGLSAGGESLMGSYIYSMRAVCESGEKFEFKGSITLIR